MTVGRSTVTVTATAKHFSLCGELSVNLKTYNRLPTLKHSRKIAHDKINLERDEAVRKLFSRKR
jgi:hypothetical protein